MKTFLRDVAYFASLEPMEAYYEQRQPRPYVVAWVASAWMILTASLHCAITGHDYIVDCDAENGSEDIHCCRCGYHHHAQF